jgi:hypothetical protein
MQRRVSVRQSGYYQYHSIATGENFERIPISTIVPSDGLPNGLSNGLFSHSEMKVASLYKNPSTSNPPAMPGKIKSGPVSMSFAGLIH